MAPEQKWSLKELDAELRALKRHLGSPRPKADRLLRWLPGDTSLSSNRRKAKGQKK